MNALDANHVHYQIKENEGTSIALQKVKSGKGIAIIQDMVKGYFAGDFDVREIEGITIAGGVYYKFDSDKLLYFIDLLKKRVE